MAEDDETDGSERGSEANADEHTDDDPLDAFTDDVTDAPTDDEDPFDRLEAGPDREGDPFARLDDGQPADDTPPIGGGDGDGDGAPEVPGDQRAAGPQEASGPVTGGNPFADIEGASADREGDPFDGESAFAGVDAGDADGVWERMDDAADPEVEAVPGRRYVEVSKHSYCERCEHFSPPPNVGCNHDGTEILEFTDMETVRVVDCPVVEEREALEDDA